MKSNFFDLDRILDLIRWQKLQDQLALVTNMAIITVDYKGIPITQHSMCCPFCQSVRANPQLAKYCQICDSRAGLEAVRSQEPFIYRCHFNIIDIAIPITVDDKYLGAIMAGQIRLDGAAQLDSFERLLSSQKNAVAMQHLHTHQAEYDAIPLLPYDKVLQSTQALFELSNYIVETAVSKSQLIHAYETFYQDAQQAAHPLPPQRMPLHDVSGNFLKVHRSGHVETGTSPLLPALQYIEENREQLITQAQMAELCHLSPSYFSRLFTHEMGVNFSQYIASKKVAWARELLEQTDDSIETISEKLGFSSAAYFIKVFKKYEGITPLLYRKYNDKLNK